jgi:hypothetical protein
MKIFLFSSVARRPMKLSHLFATVLAGALLAGCTSYPMGLKKEQWEALTPEQQADYRARQYAINEERRREVEERRREQERAAAEQERMERERLQAAYAQARYGDIVNVIIRGGTVSFAGKSRAYEPLSFDLIRGETRRVEFVRSEHSQVKTSIPVRLSEDGNAFYFDDQSPRRIVLVNDGWEKGRDYQPPDLAGGRGSSEASGITIRIQLKPLTGAPQRVIIEQR